MPESTPPDTAPTHDARATKKWRIWPRYSLKMLVLLFTLFALAVPPTQYAWKRYVLHQQGREYAALQATKDAFVAEQLAKRNGEGTSYAIENGRPSPDDFVILVRRGNTFGCLIPRKQNKKGESMDYEWCYREDGLGVFHGPPEVVKSGTSFTGVYRSGSGGLHAEFGPFKVSWSGNGPGWGFLYYNYEGEAEPVGICVTDHKSIEYIDARSPEWVYKTHMDDPGTPGDQDMPRPRGTGPRAR